MFLALLLLLPRIESCGNPLQSGMCFHGGHLFSSDTDLGLNLGLGLVIGLELH